MEGVWGDWGEGGVARQNPLALLDRDLATFDLRLFSMQTAPGAPKKGGGTLGWISKERLCMEDPYWLAKLDPLRAIWKWQRKHEQAASALWRTGDCILSVQLRLVILVAPHLNAKNLDWAWGFA